MSAADVKREILERMSACLKPLGFRKKQALYAAEQNGTVQLIQLQSSVKSDKDLLVVTVNLGIFSLLVAERIGNTHEPNIPEAHWRQRIGHFINGSDIWWDIQNQEDANRCGVEITNILTAKVLPAMRSLASNEGLKRLWQEGVSPGLTNEMRKQYLRVLEESH